MAPALLNVAANVPPPAPITTVWGGRREVVGGGKRVSQRGRVSARPPRWVAVGPVKGEGRPGVLGPGAFTWGIIREDWILEGRELNIKERVVGTPKLGGVGLACGVVMESSWA